MAKFNLLEEPWIPVLQEGRVMEASIREALLNASDIVRIETPHPLEEVALHRLLLAVLHRALRGPCDEFDALDILDAGSFPKSALDTYFDRFGNRFFLFHANAPFFQIADLPDEKLKPWVFLRPEMASGNNPTLFDHTTEEDFPTASYAEAARALVMHQSFAPGGLLRRFGVGSAKGAPLAGANAFIPTGDTLFETLVFNLVPYRSEADLPIWEARPLQLEEVKGYRTKWPLSGITRVYTWPARGVRLLDEGGGVRYMAYGPGVLPEKVAFRDPMVAYRMDKKESLLPLRFSMEKSFWRDFEALHPAVGGVWPATLVHTENLLPKERASLRVFGHITNHAKILDMRREVYPLPPGFLSPVAQNDLEAGLKKAENLGKGLKKIANSLARGVLGGKDPKAIRQFAQSIPLERRYWAQLDGVFSEFLTRVGKEEALLWWTRELEQAARSAWDATRIAVGTEARHLKALAEGERALRALLRKL